MKVAGDCQELLRIAGCMPFNFQVQDQSDVDPEKKNTCKLNFNSKENRIQISRQMRQKLIQLISDDHELMMDDGTDGVAITKDNTQIHVNMTGIYKLKFW